MAFTETPKEKEKRLAYYAKNKADAKAKEDKADAETARKFNETTNTDTSKNTNPMGDTYKKGGKIMGKKTKKYESGGDVYTGDDEIVKYRMGMADKKEGSKAEEPSYKDESMGEFTTNTKSESAIPKKTAAKLTPKAEAPTPKEEPKTSSLPRSQQKVADAASSFIEKSKAQIGQEGRDQEARYKATQAKMKESGEGLSPRMKAARGITKAPSKASSSSGADHSMGNAMRKGGSVKSASARADGCAIRGKTRA